MNKFNKGLVPLSSWCDSERHNNWRQGWGKVSRHHQDSLIQLLLVCM